MTRLLAQGVLFVVIMRVLLLVLFSQFALANPSAQKAILADVRKVLEIEQNTRAKLSAELRDGIKSLQAATAMRGSEDNMEISLQQGETKLSDTRTALIENQLRLEFLNSFISALERTTDPRKEVVTVLGDLAFRQVLASVETQTENSIWRFEIYLSIAIRDIMEPRENLGEFVKQYIQYSSIRDPKTPKEFLKSRSYIGGK